MFDEFAENILRAAESVSLDTLAYINFGSYLAIYILAFVLTLASPKIKRAAKHPIYCLANAYTAVTFVLFASRLSLKSAVVLSALFWLAAYILYGLLCAVSSLNGKGSGNVSGAGPRISAPYIPQEAQTSQYMAQRTQTLSEARPETRAAASTVRLEHAQAITDKLLQKELAKSDRQELEKLKNTLSVLQVKGSLSAAESEILNGGFNTLLKLMAKYDI